MSMKRFMHHLPVWLGVAGVSKDEPLRVRRIALAAEVLVILATLMLPFIWYAEVKGLVSEGYLVFLDRIVWGAYALEMLIVSLLVRHQSRFLRENWLSMSIVLVGIPLVLLSYPLSMMSLLMVRVVLLVTVLVRVTRQSLRMMARHALVATLGMAAFLTLSIGTLVATIDPAFNNLWDGLWWALVTISTVGYGEFVPVSAEGRLLGVVRILFGVVTFSMVMANVAAFMVSLQLEETAGVADMKDNSQEARLLARLQQIEARFDRLETLLAEKNSPPGGGRAE